MDVKKEMMKATKGGRNTHVSTPEVGKDARKKSICPSVASYRFG
jgi:hypothetical protein